MTGKSTTRKKKKRGRPPKKRTHRKTAPKKASAREQRPQVTKDALQEHCFILCNGSPVKNIKELADILGDLEEHVFDYHVTDDGNDFAKWVEDIFKDIELAQKIAGAKDKKHMQLVIYKHITHKLW